ncbi:MAG: cyclase family protein [Eubacteriales bacterium]|nr:cyclase family protein [Eubacteriales bacterium]
MLKWLSYPLSMTAPRPPAIPAPELTEFMSIKETGSNVQYLKCYNHTGTHLDTAAHVLEEGIGITEFRPEELVYERVRVLDLSGIEDDTVIDKEYLVPYLENGDSGEALIIRFGVENIRKEEPERFSQHCPGFCPEAAGYIHEKMPNLRMIGTDVPSIACIAHLNTTMEAHHEFFNRANTEKFLIIEEMKLYTGLTNIRRLVVSPWLVEGMNSGPCVIWADVEEDCK